MMGIVWLEKRALLILHDQTIMKHGGSRGMRDEGLLESALARAQNILVYRENVSLAELAAAYAFGIAKNHPFVDGNKRTAWVVARLFLMLNGVRLMFAPAEAIAAMGGLAAGRMDEAALAAWFRARIGPGWRVAAPSEFRSLR